jgi:hypothetical protein
MVMNYGTELLAVQVLIGHGLVSKQVMVDILFMEYQMQIYRSLFG